MNAEVLLSGLTPQGFRLRAEGGRLLITPFAKLQAAQKSELQTRKAELLRLLGPPLPVFEYAVYERLHLEIGADTCPLCDAPLYCWPAPPQSDEIGYACRHEPQAHRWTARLSELFK